MKKTATRSTRPPATPPAIAPAGSVLCKESFVENVGTGVVTVVVLTGVVTIVVLTGIVMLLEKTLSSSGSSNPCSGLVLFAFPVTLGASRVQI